MHQKGVMVELQFRSLTTEKSIVFSPEAKERLKSPKERLASSAKSCNH